MRMLKVTNKCYINKEHFILNQTSWCTFLPTIILFSTYSDKKWAKINAFSFAWLYWDYRYEELHTDYWIDEIDVEE